jgi:hypothetical protein
MAITHKFNDENDVAAGGTWSGDYGSTICTWAYNPSSRELQVRCDSKGKLVSLPPSHESAAELKVHLARLAIELAEKIHGRDYRN